jgi:hypothetical protein
VIISKLEILSKAYKGELSAFVVLWYCGEIIWGKWLSGYQKAVLPEPTSPINNPPSAASAYLSDISASPLYSSIKPVTLAHEFFFEPLPMNP